MMCLRPVTAACFIRDQMLMGVSRSGGGSDASCNAMEASQLRWSGAKCEIVKARAAMRYSSGDKKSSCDRGRGGLMM
jgi:hypothetical protein